jgi:hypothetical protein
MEIFKDKKAEIMLSALISKHGLVLNSIQCAQVTRATKSTRGLDEDRKKGINVPNYIDPNGSKSILYPVEEVVKYHLAKSRQIIQVKY